MPFLKGSFQYPISPTQAHDMPMQRLAIKSTFSPGILQPTLGLPNFRYYQHAIQFQSRKGLSKPGKPKPLDVSKLIQEIREKLEKAGFSHAELAPLHTILAHAEECLKHSKDEVLLELLQQKLLKLRDQKVGNLAEPENLEIHTVPLIVHALEALPKISADHPEMSFPNQFQSLWKELIKDWDDINRNPDRWLDRVSFSSLRDIGNELMQAYHTTSKERLILDDFLWRPLVKLKDIQNTDKSQKSSTAVEKALAHISQKRDAQLGYCLMFFHQALLKEAEESGLWNEVNKLEKESGEEPGSWKGVAARLKAGNSTTWPYLMQHLRDEVAPWGLSGHLAGNVIQVLLETPDSTIQEWCVTALEEIHKRNPKGISKHLRPHKAQILQLFREGTLGEKFNTKPVLLSLLQTSDQALLPLLLLTNSISDIHEVECARILRKMITPGNWETNLKVATALVLEGHWGRYIEPPEWKNIHQSLMALWDRYLLGEKNLSQAMTGHDIYRITKGLSHQNMRFAPLLAQVASDKTYSDEERLQAFEVIASLVQGADLHTSPEILSIYQQAQQTLLADSKQDTFLRTLEIAYWSLRTFAHREKLQQISGEVSYESQKETEAFLPKYVASLLPYAERLHSLLPQLKEQSAQKPQDLKLAQLYSALSILGQALITHLEMYKLSGKPLL